MKHGVEVAEKVVDQRRSDSQHLKTTRSKEESTNAMMRMQ